MTMAMGGLDPALSMAENYRVFAREAHGRSPAYESLAYSVARPRWPHAAGVRRRARSVAALVCMIGMTTLRE
jgi:hypothetical protein